MPVILPLTMGDHPVSVAIAHLNEDMKPDLAVANQDNSSVSVLMNLGNHAFKTPVTFDVGDYPASVIAPDLDHNGTADLAVANNGGHSVSVFHGNGDGTFVDAGIYPTGYAPWTVAAGDLDGDGLLDLVVANDGNDTLTVLLQGLDGKFSAAPALATDHQPHAAVALDLNGNGNCDIAVACGATDTVTVMGGNGSGTFVDAGHYGGIYSPTAMTAADLNNDGWPDLVLTNPDQDPTFVAATYTVSVLFNKGNGTFAAKALYFVSAGNNAVTVADLDGNGWPDIAVVSPKSNKFSVLLGTGKGTGAEAFEPAVDFPTGNAPSPIAAADLDGDGRPDLVIANYDDNTLTVLFTTCQP
jgi:hypothetical protein